MLDGSAAQSYNWKERQKMAFGRKLTIYLADGTPSGIRHVEIANWSGQAIACPRSRLNELKEWVEAQRPGVYYGIINNCDKKGL